MVQIEATKSDEPGDLRTSTVELATNCVVVRKKDGTPRVYQNFRRLPVMLKNDSGKLGDLPGIFDGMKGAVWYTSIYLVSGVIQLEIAEEDRPKTAFCDA